MKRVVVTGLGALTPLGNTIEEFWNNAKNGMSGAKPITRFDATHFKTQFACEIPEIDLNKHLDRNEIRKSDPFTQYGLYAATEAVIDSGLDIPNMNPFDIGVIWGSGQGGMTTFEAEVKAYVANDLKPRFNPFFVPKMITNMASGMISMKFGTMGINYTTVSACATANSALMDAYNYIKLGKAKVFITGGSESPLSEASIGGFTAMRAMSTRNDDPKTASRPFDIDRDGFVMGEGAGAIILEDYEHAKARGAKIYAEIVGAAMTSDAYHISATHPEGIGAAKAMELAIEEAGISLHQVNSINMHATSTPVGDISELNAIKKVFGNQSGHLHLAATKSMTGHLLGAAGAIEGILSILSVRDNVVPPIINTQNVDPKVPEDLSLVIGDARETQVDVVVSNSFGFGGHNAIVVFKAV